jgi:diguanylate cyclase (GGDEF)-like protein/PAS domain S-box-containing protein
MKNSSSIPDIVQGTILVVDDTPSNLTLLSRILSGSGYIVQLADNGLTAIDMALDMIPDMILLDVNMPVMDGYETCEKLKADDRTSNIPVVFISALSETEDKVRAFKVGAADYIPKPIEVKEVLIRVNTHLANQRLRNQLRSANTELENRVNELTISREQLQERESKLRAFINALPNLSFIYDDEGRYLEILTNETELLLAKAEELKGRLLKDVMPADEADLMMVAIRRAIETGKTQVVEYKLPVLSGDEHWFEGRIASMGKFPDGHSRVVFIATDITERVQLYQETQKLAAQDPLTGCFNRRHFMVLAKQELQRIARYRRPVSLMMLDIDHFKNFNDQYGHPAGDQVLYALVILCQKILRNVDILARYGGEEFVILMPETDSHAVISTAERLREEIERMEVLTSQGGRSVTASMGAASYDESSGKSLSVDVLIERADQALYEAKNAGRNCIRLWQDLGVNED